MTNVSSAAPAAISFPSHSETGNPAVAESSPDSIATRIPLMATWDMFSRLPALDDDLDIGHEKEHIVPRDGQPDLRFKGTLLASAAPDQNTTGERWKEYRVYRTKAGRYVFATVGRSIKDGERDRFDVCAPILDSLISWQNEATSFFGYDDVAKRLYSKLDIDATDRID
jgi:hypothetical protein